MSLDRMGGQRPGRRAFRPMIDGKLERRDLMAALMPLTTHVAAGGQASIVTNPDGQQFYVSVVGGGTVRAYPASGGRVNIIVDGSTIDTLLEINQIIPVPAKNSAHNFNTNLSTVSGLLNVASVTVSSGTIGDIEGYRDAILSGPIVVAGPNRVDRIAFDQVVAGASIGVGGDLNTLDILNSAVFSTSPGLFVGRDLNSLSVGGDISFTNGANFNVTRDVGLVAQAAKGSGPAGQGISITGNITVTSPSGFSIGRYLDGFLVVNGNFTGADRSLIGGLLLPTYVAINDSLATPIENVFIKGTVSP